MVLKLTCGGTMLAVPGMGEEHAKNGRLGAISIEAGLAGSTQAPDTE